MKNLFYQNVLFIFYMCKFYSSMILSCYYYVRYVLYYCRFNGSSAIWLKLEALYWCRCEIIRSTEQRKHMNNFLIYRSRTSICYHVVNALLPTVNNQLENQHVALIFDLAKEYTPFKKLTSICTPGSFFNAVQKLFTTPAPPPFLLIHWLKNGATCS